MHARNHIYFSLPFYKYSIWDGLRTFYCSLLFDKAEDGDIKMGFVCVSLSLLSKIQPKVMVVQLGIVYTPTFCDIFST